MKKIVPGNKIKSLTGYEHVRLRTEMYLGSRASHTQTVLQLEGNKAVPKEMTWIPSLLTYFREVCENSLDELIGHGFGDRIDITYDPITMEFSIEDNGRGIPIDYDHEHKCHVATMALSHLMTGRNFDYRGQTSGTNGIGAKGVNYCSEYFNVVIHRDGQIFSQKFEEQPIGFEEELVINPPEIKKTKTTKTGTKITFKPSKRVFPELILPLEFIESRIKEIAIVNKNIKVYFNGKLIKTKPKVEQDLFPDFKSIPIHIEDNGFKSAFYIIPNWIDQGDHSHSIVNNVPAFNGGIHIDTFKRFFISNLLTALEKENKKRKLTPNRTDINDGLLIYNITNMIAPNFDSQSKTRLINEEVGNIIKSFLSNDELYKNIIKKNPEWIDSIYEKCAERTQKKDATEIAKLSKKILREKVQGLIDANGFDRSKCTLFIMEGLSAAGGISNVRTPSIHGCLPLTGKIMNINGEHPKKVLENVCLKKIMNAMGLVLGEKVNRHKLRYGKILISCDQDEDGKNIICLLINFFYTYWPELFDPQKEPMIYIFNTPFIVAKKGKETKYWYSYNCDEFNPEDYKGYEISRLKGLGSMQVSDWKYALENQENAIPIIDDGKIEKALDLLFNKLKTDERKEWMGI